MHLNVVTTLRCNFRCAHCIYGCPVDADLDVSRFQATVAALLKRGLSSVTFTGGEPILHRHLGTLVEHAVERGLSVGFVSNGWFYRRYGDFVERYGPRISHMHLSLDGVEQTHDTIRGAGSFRRVMAAVRWFRRMGVPTTVNFVATEENRSELGAVVALCAASGATTVKLAGILPNPGPSHGTLSPELRSALHDDAERLAREHGIHVHVANSVHNPVTVDFCPVLTHEVLTLDVTGTLSFCCDIPAPAGRLATLDEEVDTALARRARTVNEMRLDRILRARSGTLTAEDQSCLYCLEYFEAAT